MFSRSIRLGFDPVGFSNLIDVKWLREAELKHARIAMLACAGIFGTALYHLPGAEHEVGVVAAHDAAVRSGAMNQVIIYFTVHISNAFHYISNSFFFMFSVDSFMDLIF